MTSEVGRVEPGYALGPVRRVRNRWFGTTARKGVWAIVDQTIVSGTRFVATAIIGRFGGADELGLYAMGFSIVVLVNILQDSLLLSPYAIRGRLESSASRKRFAGSILIHHATISLAALLCSCGLAAALLSSGVPQLASLFAVLAFVVPAVLLHELARRISFAHLRVRAALLMDAAISGVQLAILGYLAATNQLSFSAALGALGLASALGGGAWLAGHRSSFRVRWRRVLPQFGRNWRFGRWILGSQQIRALGTSTTYWIMSAISGPTATGIFAACSIVVTAVNPLVLGLFNVLEARSAHAFAEGGKRELLRVTRKVNLLIALALTPYLLVVVFAGEPLVSWVFDDPIYSDQGQTLIILALSTFIRSVRVGWNAAIRSVGLPQWNFFAGLAELLVTIATVAALAHAFGVVGAAYGILCGSLTGTLVRGLVFSLLQVWREESAG